MYARINLLMTVVNFLSTIELIVIHNNDTVTDNVIDNVTDNILTDINLVWLCFIY